MFERHHIIPDCLGGDSDRVLKSGKGRFSKRSHNKNCIWLYPDEHIEAHRLLAEENPDNYQLLMAYERMCSSYKELVSNTEINYLKEKLHNYRSNLYSGKNNPMYGVHQELSDETKLKISLSVTETFKDPKYHEILATNKGKKFSDEHKRKISEANKGKPGLKGNDNPFYGKKHPDEIMLRIASKHKIPVRDVISGIIYPSKKECSESLDIPESTLNKYIKSNKQFNNHLIIVYKEKENE